MRTLPKTGSRKKAHSSSRVPSSGPAAHDVGNQSGHLAKFLAAGQEAGCPLDQIRQFITAGVVLQPRQLLASAAARACDLAGGPSEIGYGGARGGGKSYWLLAQMGVDDCQRQPGLKCLLLRRVGKANLEHFEDLRHTVFAALPHEFAAHRGILTFPNGSRIIAGHFQSESDVDAYLGLEYDVIGIEEATTLSASKYEQISTCCRSSKRMTNTDAHWRPRIYSNANPGGLGHAWYKARFVEPHLRGQEDRTRFIPATVADNRFNNPEYKTVLERLTGWQRRAWLDGDWDIQAGQFFRTFRRDVHVFSDKSPPLSGAVNGLSTFNFPTIPRDSDSKAFNAQLSTFNSSCEWFAALDYGFTHYTVVLLGCRDGDGNTFIVDEHAERLWLPERHAEAIKAMLARHRVRLPGSSFRDSGSTTINSQLSTLSFFVAGADVFSRQSDGQSIAAEYRRFGFYLKPANMNRVNGWAEILSRLGDPTSVVSAKQPTNSQLSALSYQLSCRPRLFIHERCARLIDTLPILQHDPHRPEDVLKVDADEDGRGGDDAADALRYLLATKRPQPGAAVV